jgi:hypothetical protein
MHGSTTIIFVQRKFVLQNRVGLLRYICGVHNRTLCISELEHKRQVTLIRSFLQMAYQKTLSFLLRIRRRQRPTRRAGSQDDRRATLENEGHLDLPGSPEPGAPSEGTTLTSATNVHEASGKSLDWTWLEPNTEPNWAPPLPFTLD